MSDFKAQNFVHLRVHSSYSMLESTIKIPSLVSSAKKHGMNAVALTDRNNLFGSLEFALEAKKSGIQPIHGAILNFRYLEREDEAPEFGEILILAKDEIGFKNLLKLSSYPYIKNDRKYKEHITLEDLESNSDGLIILSGYLDGPFGIQIKKGNYEFAKSLANKFISIFGDRFYFEIFRHKLADEISFEQKYLELALELEIPIVATNKVYFETPDMHQDHDVLLCIAAGVTKDNPNRKFVSEECYFKTSSEMVDLFHDLPSAIENAYQISLRCSAAASEHSPMLPNFSSEYSEDDLIKKLSSDGLNERLKHKFEVENISDSDQKIIIEQYNQRLEYELSIVTKMNFAGYFLIVSDFIKWSKQNGINVGPGRGSGAGSIIAWCLSITDLDPIKFGLLFERFLNPERISMPDFDIDFCQERREEVINYVRSKYGDDRVAQIITFGKLQAKAVIKDVSRVLGLRYEIADYLTELVPFNAVNPVTLDQAVREVSELRQAYKGDGLYNYQSDNELIKQVLDTALVLEGLHRHSSVHAAGIVISGQKLLDVAPLYKDANNDMSILQYSMKYAELAGLVKFDFLGLQTLTVISKCLELIKQSGRVVDLSKISFKDEKTYEMLSKGLSVGVFQFESVGMKDTLRKLKPDCIEDLMALGALYRPGPMDNIPTYIACKHGRQKPDYLHPMLKPLLEETYGVIVYQEQVLEIAKVLAGYSLGAADLLRRAMGKKIKAEMEAQEKMFTEGAEKNGIPLDQAKSIFASVEKFAGYGFNRAHAASYGVISYYTAYLKSNYPVEFLTACMNLDISDYDKINLFKEDARKLGIEISAPDVNSSRGLFSIVEIAGNKKIIYGFAAIRNVNTTFGDEIAANREKFGKFKSVADFVKRMHGKSLTKRSLESLIKAGAFDELYENRRSLLISVPKLLSLSTRHQQDKIMQQASLFGGSDEGDESVIDLVDDFSDVEKAFNELEVLGLFAKYHPLESQQNILTDLGITAISDLPEKVKLGSGSVTISGIILKKDARMSPRGRFITLQLSDPTGNIDVTIFSEVVLKDYSALLSPKTPVIVSCDTYRDEGGIRFTANKFEQLDDYTSSGYKNLKLFAGDELSLKKIFDIIRAMRDDEGKYIQIEILYQNHGYISQLKLRDKIKFSGNDFSKLKDFIF